jgi:hypothetical protein
MFATMGTSSQSMELSAQPVQALVDRVVTVFIVMQVDASNVRRVSSCKAVYAVPATSRQKIEKFILCLRTDALSAKTQTPLVVNIAIKAMLPLPVSKTGSFNHVTHHSLHLKRAS